jgi:hypothetical protein
VPPRALGDADHDPAVGIASIALHPGRQFGFARHDRAREAQSEFPGIGLDVVRLMKVKKL